MVQLTNHNYTQCIIPLFDSLNPFTNNQPFDSELTGFIDTIDQDDNLDNNGDQDDIIEDELHTNELDDPCSTYMDDLSSDFPDEPNNNDDSCISLPDHLTIDATDELKHVPTQQLLALTPPSMGARYLPSFVLAGIPYMTVPIVQSESYRILKSIKLGLSASIIKGDISTAGVYWTRRLHTFLDLKFHLHIMDRVDLISLFWDIMSGPILNVTRTDPMAKFLDPAAIEHFAKAATRLLKKEDLLKPVADRLSFPWRPFHDLLKFTHDSRTTLPRLSPTYTKNMLSLGRLIEYSIKYAPVSAATEMFAEYVPKFTLNNICQTVEVSAMLNLFLPPQHLTVPQLRTLVYIILHQFVHMPSLDAMFVDLFTRVIAESPHLPSLWITGLELDSLAMRGLRMLELPVGSSDSGSNGGTHATKVEVTTGIVSVLIRKRNFNRVRIFAKWLVWTMELPNGFDRIQSIVLASDSFAHPSNHGSWTSTLAKFIRSLASEFCARLTESDPEPPETFKQLTRPLVLLLRNPVLCLNHSRDSNAAASAQRALRYLTAMDANSIMPMLLTEYVYPAFGGCDPTTTIEASTIDLVMDTGSHSHRLLASLSALRSTVWAMVHPTLWPIGPRVHLAELLHLLLPAIDINDHNKTLQALLFISNVFACVSVNKIAGFVETGGADDWLVEFLSKVFTLLENIDASGPSALQGNTNKGKDPSGVEGNLVQALVFAVSSVMEHLSPDLFKESAQRVLNWARSYTLLHIGDAVAQLAQVIILRNPIMQLPLWLTWLVDVIQDEIKHGAGMQMTIKVGQGTAEQGTVTLIKYLNIVARLALAPGKAILASCSQWDQILSLIFPLLDRNAFRLAHKTLSNLTATLTAMYTLGTEVPNWKDRDTTMAPWMLRGDVFAKPADVTYLWHVPSPDEIALAKKWIGAALHTVETNITDLIHSQAPKVGNESSMDVDGHLHTNAANTEALFTSFKDQHAWIKALSLVTSLLSATSTWESAPDDPQAHDLLQKRQILLNLGDTVSVDDTRKRLVAILTTAWNVFKDAGDAQIIGVSSDSVVQNSNQVNSMAGTVSSNKNNPHVSILVSLIGATRTYLNTGRRSSATQYIHFQSRRALFRMPNGLAMGPLWDSANADSGRQMGPKWTTYKSLPEALHERRVHMIHLRRAKHNTQHVPLPAHGPEFVALLRPHTLSNYTGVRRSAHGCVLAVLGQHPKQRQEYIGWVLLALARLVGSTTLDKHDRAPHIRTGLSALRTKSVIRGIAQRPQWTCPFARTLLRVAKFEDDPRLVSLAHSLTVSYMMAFNPAPFRYTHVTTATDRVSNLQWSNPSTKLVNTANTLDKLYPNLQTPEEKTAILQDAFDRIVHLYWTNGNSDLLDVPSSMECADIVSNTSGMEMDLDLDVTKMTKMHWRMFGTIISLASSLILRSDIQLKPAFVSMLMAAWIHPHPQIQKAGETVLLQIQSRLKYCSGPTPSISEVSVDDSMAQYLRNEKIDLPNGTDASAPKLYIHVVSSGWLCFHNTIKTYLVDSPAGPRHSKDDQPAVDALRSAFAQPEWVEKLFHNHSLDQSTQPGQVPNFHWNRANQIRHILVVLGPDTIVDATLPTVIQKLKVSSDKPAELACGLEWASALLRGCKHWGLVDCKRVWDEIVPVWESAMRAAGPDTFCLIYMALRFVLGNRDPRMSQPLIQAVLTFYRELEGDPQGLGAISNSSVTQQSPNELESNVSAFGIAKRLVFMRALIESLGHRGIGDVVKLTSSSMLKMLRHPYKLVRDTISTLVAESIGLMYRPSILNIETLVHVINSNKPTSVLDDALAPARNLIQLVLQLPTLNNNKDHATHVYKSIAVVAYSIASTARAQIGRLVLQNIIPPVFQLIPLDDTEAFDLAVVTLSTAAHFDLGSTDLVCQFMTSLMGMVQVDGEVGDASDNKANLPLSSWQIKLRVLRYIQIVYYRHLPALSVDAQIQIVDMVASLLIDNHVEVRTLAGITIAGLIQCSGGVVHSSNDVSNCGDGINAIAQYVSQHANQLLQRGILPTRLPGQPIPQGYSRAIQNCHGGVLALAALVRAHPYTVPVPYVPRALIKLATYAEYPVPVGTCVKSLFAEFKRTHADSWHLDMMAFDEDQRAVMANMLVSPSYYA